MSLSDTYKDLYEFELKRKTELTSALSLPTGIVSLLIGGLAVMARELHLPLGALQWWQLAAMAVSAVTCAFAVGYLFKSLFNFAYGYLPTPGQLKEYTDKLASYYVQTGATSDDARKLAETEALQYIDEQYVANADRNTANNDIKSAALHAAHLSTILGVLFTTVAGAFFVAASIAAPKAVPKIEVVNLKEIQANDSRATNSGGTAASAGASAKAASAPEQSDKGGPQPAQTASAAKAAVTHMR